MRSKLSTCLMALALLGGGSAAAEEVDLFSEEPLDLMGEAEKRDHNQLPEVLAMRALEEGRDIDHYELDFQAENLDRIVITHPGGETRVYHYMPFRVRNQVSRDANFLLEHASAFNEILDEITQEYANTTAVREGAAKLRVEGIDAIEDTSRGVIIEREDLRVEARTVTISALITDERGTRFRYFDEVPGEGDQEKFAFDDRGVANPGNYYQEVHEAIEEKLGRRLFSCQDIRDLELPPFDASLPSSFENAYGMAQGEVYGVLIFDRLNPYANKFTVRIFGLSNKVRFEWPTELPENRVEDYWNLDVMRRNYHVVFERSGDEYFRSLDKLNMVSSGWVWEPSFQRVETRKTIAYSRYYLNNVPLKKPGKRQETFATGLRVDGIEDTITVDVPVLANDDLVQEWWGTYNDFRGQHGAIFDGRKAAIDATRADVAETYGEPKDPATDTELRRLREERQAWEAVLNRLQQESDGVRQATLPPDLEAKTQNVDAGDVGN